MFLARISGVALRITTTQDTSGHIVRIDGRLDGEGVVELDRVLASLSGPSRLELPGLRSADEPGLDALRALQARGIPFAGLSRYLGLLLEADAPAPTAPPPSRDPSRSVAAGRRTGRRPRASDPRKGRTGR